jgi:hypothetical protein
VLLDSIVEGTKHQVVALKVNMCRLQRTGFQLQLQALSGNKKIDK